MHHAEDARDARDQLVTPDWAACAVIMAVASFVMGLVGFGNALVAMAFLPYFMSPATAIAVLTIYTIVFAIAIFAPVRRQLSAAGVRDLLVGTVLGTPLGVWVLATCPASTLNRIIGAVLVVVVLLEWAGVHPERLTGRRWGIGAGFLSGVSGSAVGMPGPPVVLYATTQGWRPGTIKANLQMFFFVNQVVILAGYWWAGLLSRDVWRLTASFALPAAVGTAFGILLFNRVDHRRFRTIVFALLLVSGVVLLARG
jgi:uncharacterized protein